MIFCGIGLTKINTSIKLTKLFSSDAEIIHDYEWLEEKLGPLVPMEVVIKVDTQDGQVDVPRADALIRDIQDHMQGIPDLGNTMSATTFAPSLEIEAARAIVSRASATSAPTSVLEQHRERIHRRRLPGCRGQTPSCGGSSPASAR